MGKTLTGVVFSDLGRAASFMALAWVQASLKESLGFAPYPGTLNVRVETDQGRELWRAVQSQGRGIEISAPDAAYCQARCFLVRIEGKHQGAVLLPEVEAYPEDKLEVVAPVRLKDELKLADGQRITLEFVD